MELMKIMDLMNYNYESQGTEIYNIYSKFIETNQEILTEEQLKNASEYLLPPFAFDDERKRSKDQYDKTQNLIMVAINKKIENKKRGMVA